ncbi:MAG: hypothetical protein FWG11_02495 [Promicromonosporaceae bacterium]|nr:hypothetical protein [Promicromonosporaceae bacterium]
MTGAVAYTAAQAPSARAASTLVVLPDAGYPNLGVFFQTSTDDATWVAYNGAAWTPTQLDGTPVSTVVPGDEFLFNLWFQTTVCVELQVNPTVTITDDAGQADPIRVSGTAGPAASWVSGTAVWTPLDPRTESGSDAIWNPQAGATLTGTSFWVSAGSAGTIIQIQIQWPFTNTATFDPSAAVPGLGINCMVYQPVLSNAAQATEGTSLPTITGTDFQPGATVDVTVSGNGQTFTEAVTADATGAISLSVDTSEWPIGTGYTITATDTISTLVALGAFDIVAVAASPSPSPTATPTVTPSPPATSSSPSTPAPTSTPSTTSTPDTPTPDTPTPSPTGSPGSTTSPAPTVPLPATGGDLGGLAVAAACTVGGALTVLWARRRAATREA